MIWIHGSNPTGFMAMRKHHLMVLSRSAAGNEAWAIGPMASETQKMKRFLVSAKRSLETRNPWRPTMDSAEDAQHVPDWRRPVCGGRHGPGPWMILDDDTLAGM